MCFPILLKQPIVEPYGWYNKLTGKNKNAKIAPNFLSAGKKLSFKDKIAVWVRGNIFIPDAKCLWISPSIRFLNEYLKNNTVDVMVSTGPPHSCHLIANGVKSKINIPWLVDYRDPWTMIDYFDDLKLSWFARKRHESLEKKVLANCNAIVTVGKTMAQDIKNLTNKQPYVITNGFDDSDRSGTQNQSLDKDFTITYIGTMNDSRNPVVLWEALKRLKEQNAEIVDFVKVNLVGKIEESVFKSIDDASISSMINHIGYVSHSDAIQYQNASQVLLLVINNTWNNKSILTGKIFEYLAAQRPIICIGPKESDSADIINDSKAGFVLSYNMVNEMVVLLNSLFEKYKQGNLGSIQNNIEEYSRRSLTKKLTTILNKISEAQA